MVMRLTISLYTEEQLEELACKYGRIYLRDHIHWSSQLSNVKFSEKFLKKYADDIDDWESVCRFQTLSEDFIKSMTKYINWHMVAIYQELSEPFIEQYISLLTWENVCLGQKLSDKFIRKHANELDWDELSLHPLSMRIIREFKDKINWFNYCQDDRHQFTKRFLREFANYIDWEEMMGYIRMDDSFIREFQDYILWENLEEYRSLNVNMLREFRNKIPDIFYDEKYSLKVQKEFEDKLV